MQATAAPAAPAAPEIPTIPSQPAPTSLDSLLQQQEQLAANSLSAWNELSAREAEIAERRNKRQSFCEVRGINLEQAVEFVQTHPIAGGEKPSTVNATKEYVFVVKTAQERGTAGFTMEELPSLAEKQGVGSYDTKEARELMYAAVLKAEQNKAIAKNGPKKDNKNVYTLIGNP